MINTRLVNISLISTGILTFIFVFYPSLDIIISDIFYSPTLGFQYQDAPIVKLFFRALPIIAKLFIAICLLYLLYIGFKYKSIKRIVVSGAFFLIITASLGPGLVVNSLLKENFGRARPRHVVEFAGDKSFSKAWVISDQCQNNCSFASGHAAMGFYFTAIAYVLSHLYFTRIYLGVLFFGSLVGISRIIMGGHFASDVIVSCFVILLLNHLIYLIWKNITSKLTKSH